MAVTTSVEISAAFYAPTEPAAQALRLGLKAGALLLLGVALMHTVVLWWAQGELQTAGFKPTNKVMYTRLIVPEPLPTPAPAPSSVSAPSTKTSVVAKPKSTKAVVAPPAATLAQAQEAVSRSDAQAPIKLPTSADEVPLPPSGEPIGDEKISTNTSSSNSVNAADIKRDTNSPAKSIVTNTAIAWPVSTRISYRLGGYFRGELSGSGAFEWIRESAAEYQLSLKASALVSVEYRSRGRLNEQTLLPERYEEQQPRGTTAVSFNHQAKKVSFSRITDVIDMAPDMQDRASAIMQLVRLLTTEPDRMQQVFERGERIKLNVANPTGADVWEFEVKGSEEVRTEKVNVQAWHLQRVPRKPNGDLGVDLWLSPQIKGMPVRIKLTTSADTYLDLIMTKAEQQEE
jgi:Protein of unknown function (DUF3108)